MSTDEQFIAIGRMTTERAEVRRLHGRTSLLGFEVIPPVPDSSRSRESWNSFSVG